MTKSIRSTKPAPRRIVTPLEREVRLMRKQFDAVLALKAMNATLAIEVRRLLAENNVFRANHVRLVAHIEDLKAPKVAA